MLHEKWVGKWLPFINRLRVPNRFLKSSNHNSNKFTYKCLWTLLFKNCGFDFAHHPCVIALLVRHLAPNKIMFTLLHLLHCDCSCVACHLYAAQVQEHFPQETMVSVCGYIRQKLSNSVKILKMRSARAATSSWISSRPGAVLSVLYSGQWTRLLIIMIVRNISQWKT